MYLMLGGGEHRRLTRGNAASRMKPSVAPLDFDVFS
jgi:hypothetical protein